jgi:hypothetical protein
LDVSAEGDVIRLNRINRDIQLYFEHVFREINNPEFHELCNQHNAITKLTERACGLFIRASGTAQFIKLNPTERLLTILNASGPTDPEAALDSDSVSPDITATIAIAAIDAKDGTVNIAGRDQIFVTNVYNVDPNCDQGIGSINHTTLTELIICLDKIDKWLSGVVPSKNYEEALKVRLEDTGLWFINNARFAHWKATADDFVWICGTRMYPHHRPIIIGSELVW